jgi:hypothetical protein
MVQLVAKPIIFLTFFGSPTSLTATFACYGAMVDKKDPYFKDKR